MTRGDLFDSFPAGSEAGIEWAFADNDTALRPKNSIRIHIVARGQRPRHISSGIVQRQEYNEPDPAAAPFDEGQTFSIGRPDDVADDLPVLGNDDASGPDACWAYAYAL